MYQQLVPNPISFSESFVLVFKKKKKEMNMVLIGKISFVFLYPNEEELGLNKPITKFPQLIVMRSKIST